MKKVRVGVIGLGGIGNFKHVKELIECKNAQIVAICDIDDEALERAKEHSGVKAEKCYKAYKELISDPDVDAVEVCTPNYLHAEMAKAALSAGKPVNLEKPISMSYNEAV